MIQHASGNDRLANINLAQAFGVDSRSAKPASILHMACLAALHDHQSIDHVTFIKLRHPTLSFLSRPSPRLSPCFLTLHANHT